MARKGIQEMKQFNQAVIDFNRMYGLPTPATPTITDDRLALIKRLGKFKLILSEELDEVHDLQMSINRGANDLDTLTELADWLGDLQVYCASEMTKFGLDNSLVLDIIMQSNMSKLAADGSVITDERGKVMKGPNYWKPEPKIKEYIASTIKAAESQDCLPGM